MAEEKPRLGPAEKRPVSDDEIQLAFAGPAVHSNKMYATTIASGVRIAFMEVLGTRVEPQFRTAVMLAFPDAVALRDLLTRQLANFEQVAKVTLGPDGLVVEKSDNPDG